MIIKTNDLFSVSGDDYEEVGPHDNWDFQLELHDEDGSKRNVDLPFALERGKKYTFLPKRAGFMRVSILLVPREED